MAGGRSGDEEHAEKGGGCPFCFVFLKAAQPSGMVHGGEEEIWVAANSGGRAVIVFGGKWCGANSRTRCRSGMWVLSHA